MSADGDHIAISTGKHKCACGQTASRLGRCAKCKAVIALCGNPKCGDITRAVDEHCKTGSPAK